MKKSLLVILTLLFTLSAECKRPTYLYAHGLFDTANQAFNYKNVLFDGPVVTFDFPDATRAFWRINPANSSLGQTGEIEHLASILSDQLEDAPESEFVGIGASRGAATWASLMGIYGFDQVKALILESPPDSMASTNPALHALFPLIFQKYDTHGIQPRDKIASIPKDLPILIVCVKDDHRVPYSSTVEVYRLLRESGHNNVHILVFDSGNHGKFVLGDNRNTYKNVAHAFYKKYGLPYNKPAAKAGKNLFKQTQPEPEDLL